jgi:Domain of unknown function (DUF4118)
VLAFFTVRPMIKNFEYRNYTISRMGSKFVAKSNDGYEVALGSIDVRRLIFAIDELWDGLDKEETPEWFKPFQIQALDLDKPEVARYLPAIAEPAQANASLVRRIACALLVLFVVVPVVALALYTIDMTFGVVPALAASVLSAVIYNLWILPPLWKFSVPTAGEIVYLMIKVVASISIPFALRKISERKRSVA